MKNTIITLISITVLAGALFLSGCATAEESKPVASTAPSPAASVASTPEAKPDASVGAQKALDSLKSAVTELKNKNAAGALDSLKAAHTELTAAAANAPETAKTALDMAGKAIDKAMPLVEKNDKGAPAALDAASTALEKAVGMLKGGSMLDAAKGALGAAAGAAKDATAGGAAAAKDAAKGTADAAKGAMDKAAEKKH